MTALKSTTAVRAAYDATASVLTFWADAYSATREDVAGGATVREIAAAWKSARITPANTSQVSDFVEAARLTDTGEHYWQALAIVKGTKDEPDYGVIVYPHVLILRARKARGMAYVRATLTAMESILTVEDVTDEDRAKAIVKCVRTLNAAKREAKPEVTDEATDEATGEATDEATGDEATGEATADSRADSVIALLAGMVKAGDVPSEDRQRTIVESVRALMATWKATDAAA